MKIESPLFRTAGLARTESGLPRVLAQTPAVPSTRHVLVVGLARNVAACLRTTVHRLARAITPQAQSVQWLVIESDSSDETVRELASLERDLPDFRFISLGTLSLTIPLRTARIALCRNQYLSAIRQDARYRHVAAVVVADLDGVCDLLTPAAFASCWVRDDWDACMANQRGPYYDIWALRHPLWSPGDCFAQIDFLRGHGVESERARDAACYSRMITVAEDSPWIEVESAFGGLAIYRRDALLEGDYRGLDANGAEVCEHVSLHQAMRSTGARLYINPRLVNTDLTEHTRDARWPRPLVRRARRLLRRAAGAFRSPVSARACG